MRRDVDVDEPILSMHARPSLLAPTDILINNAGTNLATGATIEMSLDKIKATFETNVRVHAGRRMGGSH